MPRQNATPKQTSGAGFSVETDTVAWTLAHMLNRSCPFDPPSGMIERVDTQLPASQWHLDDLLVTVRTDRVHRLSFSIKSNRQITRDGFPQDFIRDAWEQLLRDSSDIFVEGNDYLGLLTAPVDADLRDAVYEVLRLARGQDPKDLAMQIELPQRTNSIVRTLHSSAQCPADLAAKHGQESAASAGRLLRRMLWTPIDFEDDSSEKRASAVMVCRNLLRSGSTHQDLALWTRLRGVADRLRRSGGGIELAQLVDKVRSEFDLRDFPDHAPDWERITHDTRSALQRVHNRIGGRVSLPRAMDHDAVSKRLADQRIAVLLGASGSGKSAIAREQAEMVLKEGKVLWFDAERLAARTLADWRSHLGLTHPLDATIRVGPGKVALVVLDGIDRLYAERGFAAAAEFVEAARIGDSASPWRLLITCTPEEWTRVRGQFASRGILFNDGPLTLDLPSPTELTAVWQTFPQLTALRLRRHLAPVLLRPKVLDLLASRVTIDEDLALVGESELARLFWDREITAGPGGVACGDAAIRIAQLFADRLGTDISESALATEIVSLDLAAVATLVTNRILVKAEGRIVFEHDLYGDWIRARRLRDVSEGGTLAQFLAPRLSSPIWHRALRLYAVDLLEHANDLVPWADAFEAAGAMEGGAGVLAQDILLEATAFATGVGVTLDHPELWMRLSLDDGVLLRRLLKRLLHTATIANDAVVEAVRAEHPDLAIHVAAASRVPYAPYWYRIVRLLHAHRDEIPAPAVGVVARAVDLWLRSTLPGWPLRAEAAAVAVALGDLLLKRKEEYDSLYSDAASDQHVYRSVLAAGHEEPERVKQIVLEASGRRPKRFAPPPRPVDVAAMQKRSFVTVPSFFAGSGYLPEPWPHGPAFRVDGALQKAVLDGDALRPLIESTPDLAREVLLALVISEPKERRPYASHDDPYELEWLNWHPQFYTRGPFRAFLSVAEEAALTTILQLIEHSTDRWVEARARYFAAAKGSRPDDVSTPFIEITVGDERRRFVGDAMVLQWAVDGPDHGEIIGSALTALEKHLYDRADAGADLSQLIDRLLTESGSAAIVGLLSLVGRRHPNYLRGVLRGLLTSPEVLYWTMRQSGSTAWQISTSLLPQPLHDAYQAWHAMPHRQTSLRDWAIQLFLTEPDMSPFFDECRDRLRTALRPGGEYEGWDFVEALVAQLDRGNYALIEADGGTRYLQFTPPEDLQRRFQERSEPVAAQMRLITLPYEFRRMIDQKEAVTHDALDRVWEHAQEAADMDPNVEIAGTTPFDVVVGAAALITTRGESWREAHPDKAQWARSIILQSVDEPTDDHFRDSALRTSRSPFAADALCQLWAEAPDDAELRTAVARLVLHGPADAAGTLARSVARSSPPRSDDHKRLLNAILQRAALGARLRDAEQRRAWAAPDEVETDADAAALRDRLDDIERRLVLGVGEASIPGLDEIAPVAPTTMHRVQHGNRRVVASRMIDDRLVIAAFQGIPSPKSTDSEWLPIWERALRETLAPLRQRDEERCEEPDHHPDEWDRYLLDRVSGIIADLKDAKTAERLWQPIIDLGASAEEWVSWFARDWTTYALHSEAESYVCDVWMAMIDHALGSARWAADGGVTYLAHETGELWRALLGFNRHSNDVWSEALRPRVRVLAPRMEAWARDHLLNLNNSKAFAYILTTPAASDILLRGLTWIHNASKSSDRFWGRPGERAGPDDAVLTVLAHAWTHARDSLRRDEAAFGAFRGLLEHLVSRQHPPALELADRVGAALQ